MNLQSILKENILLLLENETIKKELKEYVKFIRQFVYEELFIYILVFCVYNICLLFFIILILLFIVKNQSAMKDKFI
jgi:hypothetical protein